MNFFSTNDFSLLESCQLYIAAKYKGSNCCKIKAFIQRCSVKKVFSQILVQAIFDYTRYHGLPLHCDKIVAKRDIHRKIYVLMSIHIAIQTSKHLNQNNRLQCYVLNLRSFPAWNRSLFHFCKTEIM